MVGGPTEDYFGEREAEQNRTADHNTPGLDEEERRPELDCESA